MVNWKPDSLHKVSGFGFFAPFCTFAFFPTLFRLCRHLAQLTLQAQLVKL